MIGLKRSSRAKLITSRSNSQGFGEMASGRELQVPKTARVLQEYDVLVLFQIQVYLRLGFGMEETPNRAA